MDCFVDSVNGNDSNTGLSDDQAVKTQSKAATLKNCTTVKYKRGSDFAEKVTLISGVTTYTNYGDPCAPLPKFHIPRSPNNGSMMNAMQRSVTIDGLYLSGSMSDASRAPASTRRTRGSCRSSRAARIASARAFWGCGSLRM